MNEDLLLQIEARMDTFSKSQKLIAKFIIESYEKAAYMTAYKLGQAVNVSESTVVRFANEMGFEGYPELQKCLRNLIRNRLTGAQRLAITNDRIGKSHPLTVTLNSDIERIRRTLEEADTEVFDKFVKQISAARHIYIFGAMSSAILARFLDYNLQMVFDNVKYVQPVNTSGIYKQIIRINEDDVFLAISFPRYSQSTVNATAFAKKCGAKVLSITDSDNSPLVKYSDLHLEARSDMASFADSLVAPLSLINALIVALAAENQNSAESTLARLEQVWDENEVYKKDV